MESEIVRIELTPGIRFRVRDYECIVGPDRRVDVFQGTQHAGHIQFIRGLKALNLKKEFVTEVHQAHE